MKTIRIVSLILLLTVAVSLVACGSESYDDSWIKGKTAKDIIARYGAFDYLEYKDNDDFSEVNGVYRNCKLGYDTKEDKNGNPTEYFIIYFNEEGLAYETAENYVRPEN